MNHRIAESVGFLSRWTLLMIAAGLLLSMGWLASRSLGQLGRGPGYELILPDAIAATETRWWSPARSEPMLRSHAVRGFVTDPLTGALSITWRSPRGYAYIGTLPLPSPQLIRWDYVPLPFGRLAFREVSAITRICPADAAVTLVDLGLWGHSAEDIGRGVDRWGQLLSSTGTLAYVHAGSAEDYPAVRRAVRSSTPPQQRDQPVVANVRNPNNLRAAFHLPLKYLKRLPRGRIRIVTSNAGLAMWASRVGYTVDMIGPSGSIVSPPENLRLHSDMRMFQESLSREAMSQ